MYTAAQRMEKTVADLYVRVKRDKQTVFVSCSAQDTVGSVIAKVGSVLHRDPATIRLSYNKTALEPGTKLADAAIESDAILHMTFSTDDAQ